MPTLGTHVNEDFAATVERAAKVSPEKKVGPYISEAIRQRLERDGMLPTLPHGELVALAEEIGLDAALSALRAKLRTATPAA